MEPQDRRTCPTCRSENTDRTAHGDYMREYWRRRRSDPDIWAKEKERLRGYQQAKPVDERRRYSRETQQRWRDQPENRAKVAERDRRISEEVLAHYGGVCACCGEHRYEFLAIDHPNNDGAAHRRAINRTPLRPWLKRQGFPPGYRVLCHNCNFARGRYGYCPHERQAAMPSN